jgi:hypothetical protein
MSQPPEERPAPPAPRLHRLLSNPIGWLAFLLVEAGVVIGLSAALPFEHLDSGAAFTLELLLVVGAAVLNYRIRRIYLGDWWGPTKR